MRQKPMETSADIELGQAAHTAIESFMRARMESGNTLDEKGLQQARDEAVKEFDRYLGFEPEPADYQRVGRGLSDTERKMIKTEG